MFWDVLLKWLIRLFSLNSGSLCLSFTHVLMHLAAEEGVCPEHHFLTLLSQCKRQRGFLWCGTGGSLTPGLRPSRTMENAIMPLKSSDCFYVEKVLWPASVPLSFLWKPWWVGAVAFQNGSQIIMERSLKPGRPETFLISQFRNSTEMSRTLSLSLGNQSL